MPGFSLIGAFANGSFASAYPNGAVGANAHPPEGCTCLAAV
jgi:hypothetical protein